MKTTPKRIVSATKAWFKEASDEILVVVVAIVFLYLGPAIANPAWQPGAPPWRTLVIGAGIAGLVIMKEIASRPSADQMTARIRGRRLLTAALLGLVAGALPEKMISLIEKMAGGMLE